MLIEAIKPGGHFMIRRLHLMIVSLTALLFSMVVAPAAEKLTVQELIARHLEGVGPSAAATRCAEALARDIES